MDPNQPHEYPPGYPPIEEAYKNHYEGILQTQVTAMEQDFAGRLAALEGQMNTTKASWLKAHEEGQAREAALRDQVAQLTMQLKGAELRSTSTLDTPEPSAVPVKPPRRSLRQSSQTPKTPTSTPKPSRSTSDGKKAANATEATMPGANKAITPKTPKSDKAPASGTQMYRLQKLDVPSEAMGLKETLELHIRILWGLLEANMVPPTPLPEDVRNFESHFSAQTTTEVDLVNTCNHGKPLINSNLVKIGHGISHSSRKTIPKKVKMVEDSILKFVQVLMANFGITHWCPDFDQTPYSMYNSACRIIALQTFTQAVIGRGYDFIIFNKKYLDDQALLLKLYNHFVHYRMYDAFKRELRNPGSIQALSESNPQYQSRSRLAEARKAWLKKNNYHRYLPLIDAKATSDDEANQGTNQEKGKQTIYWIKRRPERSREMEKFIRLLEEKRDEDFRYDTKRRRKERIRKVPEQQDDTAFPALPLNMPIDYYDPAFFNARQPHLRKQIASDIVVLLPNIEETFTKCADERLSFESFQKKYAKGVLAKYRLDDLEDFDDEGGWIDDDDGEFDGNMSEESDFDPNDKGGDMEEV